VVRCHSRRADRGFTLVELLIVMAVLAVVLSVALGAYRHARLRGAESAAVAALDVINRAQFTYLQTCGNQMYAPNLKTLGTNIPGTDSAFLSPDMTGAEQVAKSGYLLQMKAAEVPDALPTCNGAIPAAGYAATADPLTAASGGRYFGTNRDRVIYQDTASFAGDMPESGPPAHGTETK
jgi:prepilin-type N-terminal cleavage/methylation domain-containing protein